MSATLPHPDDRHSNDHASSMRDSADQARGRMDYHGQDLGDRARAAEKKMKMLWAIIAVLAVALAIVLIVWLTDAEESVTGFIVPSALSLVGT